MTAHSRLPTHGDVIKRKTFPLFRESTDYGPTKDK